MAKKRDGVALVSTAQIRRLIQSDDPRKRMEAVGLAATGEAADWKTEMGVLLGRSRSTIFVWLEKAHAMPEDIDERLIVAVENAIAANEENYRHNDRLLRSVRGALQKRIKSG